MSDEVVRGCLYHYNEQHIQVRRDFFDLCAYDKTLFNQSVNHNGKIIRDEPNQECMAKILRVIETLTNSSRTEWYRKAINAKKQGLLVSNEPDVYPVELAYSAISHLLYHTYGESTIRNSVAVLIQRGYIIRTQATHNSIPKYILNAKIVQDALKKQEEEYFKNGVLNLTPRTKKRGRPSKQSKIGVENNSQAPENNSQTFGSNSQTSENNTNKNTYKNSSNKLDKKGVSTASVSSLDTKTPTPIDTSLNPLGNEDTENQEREKEITTEVPLEQLPWDAEKALMITEAIVNISYKNFDVALQACQKILDIYHPTEEEYIGVVRKALAWYRKEKKTLYPMNLLALRPDGLVWFDVFHGEIKQYGLDCEPVEWQSQQPEKATPGMTQREAEQLLDDVLLIAKQRSYAIQGHIEQSSTGWAVNAVWDGFPVIATNRSEWEDLFTDELNAAKNGVGV